MGLGACGVGAFMDDAINAMLGVDGVDEAAVYMMAVGHRRDVACLQLSGPMLDFLRRDQPGFAAVHFAGTVALPADAFERLRDRGYALTDAVPSCCGRSAEHLTHGTAEPPRVPRLAGHR